MGAWHAAIVRCVSDFFRCPGPPLLAARTGCPLVPTGPNQNGRRRPAAVRSLLSPQPLLAPALGAKRLIEPSPRGDPARAFYLESLRPLTRSFRRLRDA